MSEEQTTTLLLKGFICNLPEKDREKVEQCIAEIREIQKKYGKYSTPAIGLIGAELAE